jgi:MerR family transcriptional regulator, light-induced transcriptional regulator
MPSPSPRVARIVRRGQVGEEGGGADARALLERAFVAVEEMQSDALERTLVRAAVVLQPTTLIEQLVLPLLARIGERWEHGTLGPAAEHLASGVVRRFLEWLIATAHVAADSPLLLTATPRGQLHEFGALLSGAVASGLGWRTVFLGADLPSEEISAAAAKLGARGVALSAIHPNGPVSVVQELSTLRALLPPEVRLLSRRGGCAGAKDRVGR